MRGSSSAATSTDANSLMRTEQKIAWLRSPAMTSIRLDAAPALQLAALPWLLAERGGVAPRSAARAGVPIDR